MKILKIIGIIFGFFLLLSIFSSVFIKYRFHFKPLVNFIVNNSIKNPCNSKKDCSELRQLPKMLQGKKIVFGENINIQFDPFQNSSEIDNSELDFVGFVDPESALNEYSNTFIDPTINKRGYLKEREYKIVRSVYYYDCYFCIDSSNYSYIVLEDSKGNRFMALLNDTDVSTHPNRSLIWDEYLPYFLGKDVNGNELQEARLEDI